MLKRTLTLAFIVVFCCIGMVFAQSTTATLNGTVTDAAGAVIPDAQVTITNQATNQEFQVRTRGDGTAGIRFADAPSGTRDHRSGIERTSGGRPRFAARTA